jgi:hypothetical protein
VAVLHTSDGTCAAAEAAFTLLNALCLTLKTPPPPHTHTIVVPLLPNHIGGHTHTHTHTIVVPLFPNHIGGRTVVTASEGLVVTSSNTSVISIASDGRTAFAVADGSATITASLAAGCGNASVAETTFDVSVVLDLPVAMDLRLDTNRLAGERTVQPRNLPIHASCHNHWTGFGLFRFVWPGTKKVRTGGRALSPVTHVRLYCPSCGLIFGTPYPRRSDLLAGTPDAASALGLTASSPMSVVLHYPNGVAVDFTGDPRVQIDAVAANQLVSVNTTSSGGTELLADASAAGGDGGSAVVSVRLSHLPASVVAGLVGNNATVTVVTITSSRLYALPYPEYPGSNGADASILNTIAFATDSSSNNNTVFQQTLLQASLVLSDGTTVNTTGSSPHVQYRVVNVVSGDSQAFTLSAVSEGRAVLSASSEAVFDIDALVGTHSVTPTRITSTSDPVYVTHLAFGAGAYDTLSGVRGVGHADVDVSAVFTDGTEYVSLFTRQGGNDSSSLAPVLPGMHT